MNPYLEPAGFLGTGASLLADLTLLAYVLLIVPAMLAGFVFARRGKYRPNHKWTMIGITVLNWALILILMVAAYRFDVAENVGEQPGNARYLLPTLHAVLGLPAQLLATYIVYRMLREDRGVAAGKRRGETKEQLRRYWFLNAKPFMRVTLLLWLATALLGIFTYLVRYDVLPVFAANGGSAPEVTVEPLATPEATPLATVEVESEDDSSRTDEPATTPEAGSAGY